MTRCRLQMQLYSYLLRDSWLTKLPWIIVKTTHIGAGILSSLSYKDVKQFSFVQQEVSRHVGTVWPACCQDTSPASGAIDGDPGV